MFVVDEENSPLGINPDFDQYIDGILVTLGIPTVTPTLFHLLRMLFEIFHSKLFSL
jgi:hypothetical protein